MDLGRTPVVRVFLCAILPSSVQSWLIRHVEVVIVSQEKILLMDKEQRLFDYVHNSNSHIFLKLIYLSHGINYLHELILHILC